LKKLYYKNQLFYIIVATVFFAGALFFYLQNINSEKNAVLEFHKILEKSCSVATKISSYVRVEKKGKIYTANLSEQDCADLNIGENVKLFYNKKYDYFFYPGREKVYSIRVIFSGIIFFLVLLPWKFFRNPIKRK